MLLKRINFYFILCIFIFKCTVLLSYDIKVYNTDLLSKSDFYYKSDLLNNNNTYHYNENVFKLPDFLNIARESSWELLDNIIENQKYEICFCKKEDSVVKAGYNLVVFDLQCKSMCIENYVFLKKNVKTNLIFRKIPFFMSDSDFEHYSKIYNSDYNYDYKKETEKDESLTSMTIPILENSMINVISDVKERIACVDDIYINYPTRYLTLYDLCFLQKGNDIKDVERLLGNPDFIINTKTFMSYCYYYYLKVAHEPVILRRLVIDFNDHEIISNINYIF